jgi:hypothetical protein
MPRARTAALHAGLTTTQDELAEGLALLRRALAAQRRTLKTRKLSAHRTLNSATFDLIP